MREVLDRALPYEHDRDHDRHRRQHPEDGAHHVLPEVAEALTAAPDDAPDQRDRDDDPDTGGEEVLHCQPGHLAEVAHRRLAAVELPVRVRHERRSGVERHAPRSRVVVHRVESREVPQCLRTQDQVQQQPPGEGEDDQAARVLLPVLPLGRVDVEHPVGEPLRNREQRVEERALARVDLGEVAADRDREQRQQRDEEEDRQPAGEGHWLELLPTQ